MIEIQMTPRFERRKPTHRRYVADTARVLGSCGFALIFNLFAICLPVDAQIIRTFTEPILQSDVAAAESGIIIAIHVREGDIVKRGDVLAEIDKEILKQSLRLAEAKAQSTAKIRSLKAGLDLAAKRVESLNELIQQGHANPLEVDQSQAEYDKAHADYVLAEEEQRLAAIEVDRIKAQLNALSIRSPIDGVVVDVHREIGEYISSNEPMFATVVQLDRLRARFYLRLDQINELSKGNSATVTVGDKLTTGIIKYVAPVIDPDSGTGRVDVLINNRNSEFRCGDRCQWGAAQVFPTSSARLPTLEDSNR